MFVDVNLKDFNASFEEIKKINRKTKAILLVHVLGTSIQIDRLINVVKKNILIVRIRVVVGIQV